MTGVEFAVSNGQRSAQIAHEINSVITMLPRETGDYLVRTLNQGVLPVGASQVALRMSPEQAAHVFCDELTRMRDIANQRMNATNPQEQSAAIALSRFNTPEGLDRFVRRETNMLREMAGEIRVNPPATENLFRGTPAQTQAQLERMVGSTEVRGMFQSPQVAQPVRVMEEQRVVASVGAQTREPASETSANSQTIRQMANSYGISVSRDEDPTITFLHTRERLVGYIQSMESGTMQIDGRSVAINQVSPTQIPADFQRILRRYGGNTREGIEALRTDLATLDQNFQQLRRSTAQNPAQVQTRVVAPPAREQTIEFETPTTVKPDRRPVVQNQREERELNLPDANVNLVEPQLGTSRRTRRSILDIPEPENRVETPSVPVVEQPQRQSTVRPVVERPAIEIERPTEVVLPVTEIRATRPQEPQRIPEPIETRLEPTIITGTRTRVEEPVTTQPQVETQETPRPTRSRVVRLSPRERSAVHDAAQAITTSADRIRELRERLTVRISELESGNPTPAQIQRIETQLRLYGTQVNAARAASERNTRVLGRYDENRLDEELLGEVQESRRAVENLPQSNEAETFRSRIGAVRERIARSRTITAEPARVTQTRTTLQVQGTTLQKTRERTGQTPAAYELAITPVSRGGIDVQLPLRFRAGVEDNAPIAAEVSVTITLQDLAHDGGYARIYAAISRAWRAIGRDSGAGIIPFMPDRSFNITLRNALTAMSRGVRGPDAEIFRNAIAGIPSPQALRRTADGAIDLSQY